MRLALWLQSCLLLGITVIAVSVPVHAACIPYCNVGIVAPAPPTYTAAYTGDLVAEFYGYQAHNLSMIRFVDVTTGYKSPWVLPNLFSKAGTQYDFGTINQGDVIAFQMWDAIQNSVQPGAGYVYDTRPRMNPDLQNHFYSAQFMGGTVNGTLVGPGIFMGGEDLPQAYTDWDYNDLEFVFRVTRHDSDGMIGVLVDGVSIDGSGGIDVATPEPASLQLMLLGAVGIGSVVRRKFSV